MSVTPHPGMIEGYLRYLAAKQKNTKQLSFLLRSASESNFDIPREKFVVHARGWPGSATAESVAEFFSDCNIRGGAKNGIHFNDSRKGCGWRECFVELVSLEDMENALAKSRTFLGKSYVEVFEFKAGEREQTCKRMGQPQDRGNKAVVRLSGLPFQVSEEEIPQFFAEGGDESDARLFGRLGGGVPAKPTGDAVDTETIYKMSRAPRGIAIIINNENFLRSSGLDRYPRNGTDVDRDSLEKLFKSLKFEVRIYNDITKYEIRRIAKEMATLNHSDYEAFIFSILTHGEEGLLYGADGTLSTRDLTSVFKDATTLAGKPKIFLFQACQGDEYMDGRDVPGGCQASSHEYRDGMDVPDGCLMSSHEDVDGMDVPYGPQASSKASVPAEADFLFAYSTVPGYYSWRNSANGSWFIHSLTKVFEENAERMDILRMLTRVNAMVSKRESRTRERYSDSKRQISSIVSTLRKELYFFPEKAT